MQKERHATILFFCNCERFCVQRFSADLTSYNFVLMCFTCSVVVVLWLGLGATWTRGVYVDELDNRFGAVIN